MTLNAIPRLRPGLLAGAALALVLPTLSSAGELAKPSQEPHVTLPTPAELAALPPDGGEEFNRLVFEQSPYLLQHARNPVDWYPWGTEAFERAEREDKPIFLSIGYSTCHWCHVMERESFEDAEVAALLNEHFVCVKVDREERPDVDGVYMSVTQALTGRGGWPMTVLMTADARPFFAGTYIPKTGRDGRGGLMEFLPHVAKAWKESRDGIQADAARIVEHLARTSAGAPGPELDVKTLARAFEQLSARFDAARGGFLPPPKFPRPHDLRFLLRYARRTGDEAALAMVETTLRALRRGGIFDHVGFGFHRYSTDVEWLVPHFEKMLYDQALLAICYVEAWQATGAADFRRTAEEVLAYVLRDMTSPEGGFHSAEDADSEGEEGRFYLWTTRELEAVLGAEDGRLAASVWNATEEGNFADEATGERTGKNILHLARELPEFAAEHGIELAELEARVESMRARLFASRETRVHPLEDDKVLTDWNGLMIAACAAAGRAFDEPRYVAAARHAGDFLLRELRDGEGRLYKRHRGGESGLPAMLEDYAFAVWGFVELYEATFEVPWLRAALELTEVVLAHFADAEEGGFYLAPDDGEALIVRAKEIYDGAIPSGNSVMATNLLRLARLTGETSLEARADGVLRAFSSSVSNAPVGYTHLLLALDFAVGPAHEIVVAGERDAPDTQGMLRAIAREFVPNAVVLFRPAGEAEPEIARIAEYAAHQDWLNGKATAYVCREFTCAAPTHDVEQVLRSLRPAR